MESIQQFGVVIVGGLDLNPGALLFEFPHIAGMGMENRGVRVAPLYSFVIRTVVEMKERRLDKRE